MISTAVTLYADRTGEEGTEVQICHAIESAATGSGSVMLTLADLGARAGHDVTVVYSPTRASAQFLARSSTIDGVRFVPMPMARAPQPHDLYAAARLGVFLRRHRFDVVHSHSSKAGALARLAGLSDGAAQIYSPHGFVTMAGAAMAGTSGAGASVTAYRGGVFGAAERVLGRLGDAIVAVSEKERDHGVALGIAREKLTVIPNGIDDRLIAAPALERTGRAGFTVGFVGRLSEQKHPLLALDAFRVLLATRPDSRLVVIGGGELRDAVAARVEALGIGSRVTLVGEAAALPFYADFDALLCSSRYEGMPLTFLEALAHGVPIVSTDVGGVDELIEHGATGHVCAASADALGAALALTATLGEDERATMRERSLARARRFTTQVMFDRTIALYDRHRRGN